MFGFLKKKNYQADFSFAGVDFHNHILPGLDDGAKSLDESLAMIRGLQELGFRKIISTPHIFSDYYPNTSRAIQSRQDKLNKALNQEGIDIEIQAAAEYFLDDHFKDLLAKDDILTFGKRHVLIEMSFFSPYPELHAIIFGLKTKGYNPILAHPERYLYLAKDFEVYRKIRNYGCEFQLNLLSLAGVYGTQVARNGLNLLKKGLIDYIATDLHTPHQLEALFNVSRNKKVMDLLQQANVQNHRLH